jgi:hypothetical protein
MFSKLLILLSKSQVYSPHIERSRYEITSFYYRRIGIHFFDAL